MKTKRVKEKIRRTKGEKVLFSIVFVILLLFSLTYIIAYAFAIMNTFKSPTEYILSGKFELPKEWVWNYGKVFTELRVNGSGFWKMVFHSIWFAVTGSVPALLSAAAASYAYSRYHFPGRRIIFMINIILLTLSLPGAGPAFYKLFCDLGMRNSWRYLLGCWDGFGSRFIILAGFWKSVDWAYAEAAYMDGASEWQVFWKVMMPQAKPMLGVFFLLSFITSWTNHEFTMLYMPKYPSIAYGLFEYQYTMQRAMDMPTYFAGLVLTAIPSLILYFAFQDKILQNMNIGGLKG